MALLTLGGLALDGLEVPASVRFGGAQRSAVHKLLGGGRVIDTMGRDDFALSWSGILSGSDASDRARTLDAMRVAGAVLPLAWESFCYDVVLTELHLEFCSPWWITYKIECTVLQDLAQTEVSPLPVLQDSVVADLTAAAAFVDVGSLVASASQVGAVVPGGAGVGALVVGLTSVQAAIMPGLDAAELGMSATDIPTLVSAAGSLAQLTAAQGFVGRALTNLSAARV